jgi:hypothetical protein
MHRRLLALAAALALAITAPLHAENVTFTFYGQVTDIPVPFQPLTNFHAGDPFALTLEYTPSGPSPAYGYYLTPGTIAVSPETVSHPIAPYTGLGPPYADTYFADPTGYRMYCYSSATLSNNVFSFAMLDEDAGPWGSVNVGSDFPAAWFAHPADPLPGGVNTLPFAATGTLYFNFLNASGVNLTGAITSASVSSSAIASSGMQAVPEPASLFALLFAVPALLRRRQKA